jgi:starch-binding outer membrane protein, SusD/RagB family
MKKKYYILASLLVCFIGMTSCVGDLDVQPKLSIHCKWT